MELWRVSIFADLSGVGGLLAEGRWHSQGQLVVYLADHPSTALLERLVHVDPDVLPLTYQLLRIRSSSTIEEERVEVSDLPVDWRRQVGATQQIGDDWLGRAATALLRVPSALVPHAENVLLNPAHRDAGTLSIAETIVTPFDPRFWKLR